MKLQTFPWYENYPAGMPQEINAHQFESLVSLLEQCVNEYGALPAFESMGTDLSFEALDRLSQNFAAYLQQDLGLKAGTRIAIQLPNLLQYPIAMFGAFRAGMVVVNINPQSTATEMKHQLVDSGAEVILILADFAHKLEKILPDTAVIHIITTRIGDQLGSLKKMMVNGMTKYIKKTVPEYDLPMAVSFNHTLKRGSQLLFQRVVVMGEDTAFLQYTGVTTGASKGAVLSHTNVVANIEQLSMWLSVKLEKGKETVITASSICHTETLLLNCFTLMKMGARNVLIANSRDREGCIKTLKKHRFSILVGTNTFYSNLMSHSCFDHVDFSHLKMASAWGATLQKIVAECWKSKTGVTIVEGYNSTETSILACNIPLRGEERVGTIGLPLPSTRIIIANEMGDELPFGEFGKVYAKGPQIMRRYWDRPEETAKVFTKDGWFKTGDWGIMDKDGFAKVLGCKKELRECPQGLAEFISIDETMQELQALLQ